VELFYVKILHVAASVFEISCGKTNTQTNAGKNPIPATAVGLGNDEDDADEYDDCELLDGVGVNSRG